LKPKIINTFWGAALTIDGSKFGAVASAAGYLYQARLALAESLRFAYGESGIEVAIERFDDVSFELNGQPLELLQTKHHVIKSGDLTDTSVDLWKTLRIWSEAVKSDPSTPSRVRFALITTATVPPGTAASLLRPASPTVSRDCEKAEHLLTVAASQSSNASLTSAFEAFQALAPEMRRALLRAVEVMDKAPRIDDLEKVIEDRLRIIAPRGKATLAREQVEGWWWPRICKALQEGGGVISILELEAKLDEIRESMKRDALPVEMEHADPTDADLAGFDEMNFLRQLRAVGIGGLRVGYAKRDFYRASTEVALDPPELIVRWRGKSLRENPL
jgi:hypothetical protein